MILCGRINDLEPPKEVQAFLARYGGRNLFGGPNYRIVWSMSRRAWRLTRFVDHDESGDVVRRSVEWRWRRVHTRAHQKERFIIEVYQPPETFGDPEAWWKRNTRWVDGQEIAPLGLFPSRGDYRFLATVEKVLPAKDEVDEQHLFAWPTREYVKSIVDAHRLLVNASPAEIAARIATLDEMAGEAETNFYLEQIRNTVPQFAHQPHAFVQGRKEIVASAA